MNTLAEIANKALTLKTISGTLNNESRILSYILEDKVLTKEVTDIVEKWILDSETTLEKLNDEVEKRLFVENRQKHSFNTLADLNAFIANNKCGEWWLDGKFYSVYKY